MRIFLDSGAFSAWNSGKIIEIKRYIDCIRHYEEELEVYANLDVIRNADASLKNLKILEDAGLNPIPIFHFGSNEERYLAPLIEKYNYIGLGGMTTTLSLVHYLDRVWKRYLLDENGKAQVKVHAFGMTNLKLVLRYPWYSIDSSSWVLRGGGFGLLDLPIRPWDLSRKENCYITSVAVGKGIKKFSEQTQTNKGLFNIDPISQIDFSFKNSHYKTHINNILNEYHFSLDELSNDSEKRSIWNAIYLMTTIRRFSKTKLYLATNNVKILDGLVDKMNENEIPTSALNVLLSFAMIDRKKETSTPNYLDKLISLKHKLCK